MPSAKQVDEGLRLLRAAVEGMGDAADAAMTAQVLEQDVLGLAHMQQHRQANSAASASWAA